MGKRFLSIFATIVVVLSGCSINKYNADFFDDIEQHLNESFITENQVSLVLSENDKPKQILWVIDNYEKYESTFNYEYQMKLDFEKQFLIVCTFTSINKKKHSLDTLSLNDGILTIKCSYRNAMPGHGDCCAPYQRWCAIKMDAVEYNSIDFLGE